MEKHEVFAQLCSEVSECRMCTRMADSARILGPSAGSLTADLMFVGEAPGRRGADETRIPFHGDRAGDNFESLLNFVGIRREEIFVTNAVLCNPKDKKGNNAPPSRREINNCSNFLARQIDIVQPKVVVSLGSVALQALSCIESHNFTLKNNVRTKTNWYGRYLIPLYHPGQRAMMHRSYANQRSDYQYVLEEYSRLGRRRKYAKGSTPPQISQLVGCILQLTGRISYFGLHKLFYLLENKYIRDNDARLSGAYFIRQKDGPYCTDLQLRKLKRALPDIQIEEIDGKIFVSLHSNIDLFNAAEECSNLPKAVEEFLRLEVDRIGARSDAELKASAYLTTPMRQLLVMEKKGVNTYNAPIFG